MKISVDDKVLFSTKGSEIILLIRLNSLHEMVLTFLAHGPFREYPGRFQSGKKPKPTQGLSKRRIFGSRL